MILYHLLFMKIIGQQKIGVEMDAYYYTAENHYRLTSTCPNVNLDATLLVNWIRLLV